MSDELYARYNIDFSTLPEWMTPKGYALVWKTERFIIHRGGSGSSKSYSHAQKIIYKTLAYPGCNTLVARKVADTNRTSTFALLKQVISAFELNEFFTIRESDLTIKCINGNEIIFKGMDTTEKIKSVTFSNGILTDIWMEEASEFTKDDFSQLNLRLRGMSKNKFQMTLTFNPIDSMHWIKGEFYDKHVEDSLLVLSTYKDNQFLDEGYKRELESLEQKNPYLYQVYACGEWGNAGDIVFRNAKYERCPFKEEDFDEILIGMDFGYEHYYAIEKIGLKDGVKYSYAELYVRQHDDSQAIDANEKKKILEKDQLCTADSADAKAISAWTYAGYRIERAKKGKGTERVQLSYLSTGDWYIDPVACPGLAAEVRGFSYRKDKNGVVREIDEAQGIYDDAIAACRYAIERKTKHTKFVLI